jgi:hypothetical protein
MIVASLISEAKNKLLIMKLTTTLIASFALCYSAHAATIELDATLTRATNASGSEQAIANPSAGFYVGNAAGVAGPDNRSFIDFDLSSLSGETVTSAVFSVNFDARPNFGNTLLFSIDSSWDNATNAASLFAISSTELTNFPTTAFTQGATGLGGTVTFDITSLIDTQAERDSFNGLSIRGQEGFTLTRHDFSGAQIIAQTAAVPEPSSTALLGLGGITLIMRRRK